MPAQVRITASLLLSLLVLSACASQEQRSARLLNQRLQDRLASDIAANRVALQPLPVGARVTFLDSARVPGGPVASDPSAGSSRASLVEGLLDPALMRVAIADTSDLPPDQKARRIDSLSQYFQAHELGDRIQPDAVADVKTDGAQPGGIAVTIQVACPRLRFGRSWEWGYGDGKRKPGCF